MAATPTTWSKEGSGTKTSVATAAHLARSATIITTRPNELMATMHDRMPVILKPDAHARWLDQRELKPEELNDLLKPYPADEMEAFPVSTMVNSPRNDGPQLIERSDPPKTTLFD